MDQCRVQKFPANSVLVFEVELLDIVKKMQHMLLQQTRWQSSKS